MQYYPTQTSYQNHCIYHRGGHANLKIIFRWTVKTHPSYQKKWVYHGGGHANLKSPYITICVLPSGNLTLANRSHTTTVILWSIPTGFAFQSSGMFVLLWRIWCIDLRFQQIKEHQSADSGFWTAGRVKCDIWDSVTHILQKPAIFEEIRAFLVEPIISDQTH